MAKPKIFIGSSVEGLAIAYAVQQNLTHDAEITVWDQGVFELSQTTLESLVAILEKSDFAIFVFSPDDIIRIRKKQFLTVRDNVIFELGLFIGKLGRERSFIVMPDKPAFHIPTDLLGVTAGKYDTSRTDGSYQAATGPVCHQIRIQIKKLGLLQNVENETPSQKEVSSNSMNEDQIETDWWSFYIEKKYKEALELIEKKIQETPDKEEQRELTSWKIIIEYRIDAKKGREEILNRLKTEPDDKFTYAAMSKISLLENELPLALNIINEGLSKFKDYDVLISRKSDYLSQIGKGEQAIDLILKSDFKENEDLIIKLAELYESLEEKKHEDAYLLIKNAYKNNPSSDKLAFKLARLAQDTKRETIALYLLDILTTKEPNNVSYWGYLGNSCVLLELSNKALTSYKKAEKLSDSKDSWILMNIGNILNSQGFYSFGREYFKTALEMDPDSEYSFERVTTILKNEEKEKEKYSKLIKEGLNEVFEVEDSTSPPGVDLPPNK